MLSVNQPLVMLTPLTDKKIKMRYHVVSENEHRLLLANKSPKMFFLNNQRKIAEMNDKKMNFCPFHRKK
jgi:hypothetical protein